jgi:hypothetical protein
VVEGARRAEKELLLLMVPPTAGTRTLIQDSKQAKASFKGHSHENDFEFITLNDRLSPN